MRKSILGQSGKRKRRQDNFDIIENDSEIDEEEEDAGDAVIIPQVQSRSLAEKEVVVNDISTTPSEKPSQIHLSVGSALQRNPDGSIVQPKYRAKSKGKQVSL